MSYLAMFHWGWLLGALLLGFVAGWISVVQRGRRVSKVTARWLAVLVAALLAAALARVIPGRPGYWLDLGLMLFGLYLVGCPRRLLVGGLDGFAPEPGGLTEVSMSCGLRGIGEAPARKPGFWRH